LTDASLHVVVATTGPIVRWQARCVEALLSVPGVVIDRWIRLGDGEASRVRAAGAAATPVDPPIGVTPFALRPAAPTSEVASVGSLDLPVLSPLGENDPPVDVLLDLTHRAPAHPSWAGETWRFGYGPRLQADPVRASLVDWIVTPGRSRVALVSEPGHRILRDGRLSWVRGTELERVLLDPSDWPALAARGRIEGDVATSERQAPGSGAGTQTRGAGVPARELVERLPTPLLRVAGLGRRIERAPGFLVSHDAWNIGVVDAPIAALLESGRSLDASWLPARPGHFAADPFGIERDGTLHIFYEDYDQRAGRGGIGHVSIGPDGAWSDPEVVLDPGIHASYPFLVVDDGKPYLIPETSTANEVVLYETTAFPRGWRRAATLLSNVPAVDATVIQHEGIWWMFATHADLGPNHSLFLWYADSLRGPWRAHDRNPVKTDARSARPGGTPFVSNGRLYRPSQDCETVYGRAVVLNVVEELTPRVFVERPVKTLETSSASRFPEGPHTLSQAGSRTLIDGNRRRLVRETLELTARHRLRGLRRRIRTSS
jgi:hypothetical protein